jgi:hypothetical protein
VQAWVQGVPVLEHTSPSQGRATDVQVPRRIRLHEQSAQEAVRQWAHTPILLSGVRVPVIMTVTVNFKRS